VGQSNYYSEYRVVNYDILLQGENMSGPYTIILEEDDMELLHDDYTCVEAVVEKIVEQAKSQGYVPPETST
jgi:hypothetical protein